MCQSEIGNWQSAMTWRMRQDLHLRSSEERLIYSQEPLLLSHACKNKFLVLKNR